jgi:uncharacterized small protein (DUF1192 family)
MKSVKVSNSLNGIESSGTIRILTTLTRKSFEILKEKPFSDAYINEAIQFHDKKDAIEERLNQMQNEIERLKREYQKGEVNYPAQSINALTEIKEVIKNKVEPIIKEETKSIEEENKSLLLGLIGNLDDEDN